MKKTSRLVLFWDQALMYGGWALNVCCEIFYCQD